MHHVEFFVQTRSYTKPNKEKQLPHHRAEQSRNANANSLRQLLRLTSTAAASAAVVWVAVGCGCRSASLPRASRLVSGGVKLIAVQRRAPHYSRQVALRTALRNHCHAPNALRARRHFAASGQPQLKARVKLSSQLWRPRRQVVLRFAIRRRLHQRQ